MKKEHTATVYIIEGEKVLLIFHKKLQKWLPPGGHMEPNELPHLCAIREAFEETGYQIAIQPQENIWIESRKNCVSIPRPYLCLLENLPAIGEVPPHQHIDYIYLGYPIGGSMKQNLSESTDIKWFTFNCIQQLKIEIDIFSDTFAILKHILFDKL